MKLLHFLICFGRNNPNPPKITLQTLEQRQPLVLTNIVIRLYQSPCQDASQQKVLNKIKQDPLMVELIKRLILGSPIEKLARYLYIRLDPSIWSRYDRQTLSIMKCCLHPNSNCIDVGAHRGTILAEIIRMAPEGIHYAFEPLPEHYQYLVKSFPGVRVFPLALSNTRQLTTFSHDLKHPTRSGFVRKPPNDDEPIETITVQTDLMDNIIPPSLPIHFIKIDVEGAEFQVLQGGVNTIRTHKPVIIFEHTYLSKQYYGVTSDMIYEFLTKDCHLQVSLMNHWLKHEPPLSRQAFSDKVASSEAFYFVAHP